MIKDKEKYCTAGDSDKQQTECTPRKKFRCWSVDHLIYKCPKSPKDNEKLRKQVRFN